VKNERWQAAVDVAAILAAFVVAWHLATSTFKVLDPVLFPTPVEVAKLFFAELPEMAKGLASSMYLMGSAYLLALATAIPAGIVVGASRRLRNAVDPLAKVLGAIPPIVYIPYAIALLPSFSAASIFVIWSGAFWPVFVNTVSGVVTIPANLVDSARMLHLRRSTYYWRVVLPGAMPSILTGASLGLIVSFLLLTAAELIGATEGLGWYVKNYSDFADYGRVVVGIIFIGIVVTALSSVFKLVERRLLRYREAEA
jgi:NitT/TauT family transport system permease protein